MTARYRFPGGGRPCTPAVVAVALSVVRNTAALKKSVPRNLCRPKENVDGGAGMQATVIDHDLPGGRYATLSCRKRNVMSDSDN